MLKVPTFPSNGEPNCLTPNTPKTSGPALNILHVLDKSMPPSGSQGGLPALVHNLATAQVKAGDNVTVATSCSSDKRESTETTSYRLENIPSEAEQLIKNFDIVHSHGDYRDIEEICKRTGITFLKTVHGLKEHPENTINTVYVSKSHAKFHGSENYVANGINLQEFSVRTQKEDYLLFLGKVSRTKKGVGDAIKIARQTRNQLIIAGGWNQRYLSTWFPWPLSRVKPVGVVQGNTKKELLAGPSAFYLLPSGQNLSALSWLKPWHQAPRCSLMIVAPHGK